MLLESGVFNIPIHNGNVLILVKIRRHSVYDDETAETYLSSLYLAILGPGQNLWSTRTRIIDRKANTYLGEKERGGDFFCHKKEANISFWKKESGLNFVFI